MSGSRVYDLMIELSEDYLSDVSGSTKKMMDALARLLRMGEIRGNFRSAILDTYYAEFAKAGIQNCVAEKCKKIQDSLYYPVLEILFKNYYIDPDITDDHGRTPMYYAKKSKCQPYIDYLKSKGSEMVVSSSEDSPKADSPKAYSPKAYSPKAYSPKAKSPKESVKKPKRKKTQKKKAKKKCSFRKSTSRCVNGDKQSRKCYRNKSTKRCRKKR